MLSLLCYTAAVVLFGIAALLPAVPYRDRLVDAGLCALTVPLFVHAAQNR